MTIPRRAAAVAAAILALTVAAAGCGDDDSAAVTGDVPAATAPSTSGDQRLVDPASGTMLPTGQMATNVADVIADTTGEPVVAVGYLFVEADGSARLCNAIMESFPPQCGTPAIPVVNLPPELVAGLTAKDGLRWSETPVQLMGTVKDGVFQNDPELLAAS